MSPFGEPSWLNHCEGFSQGYRDNKWSPRVVIHWGGEKKGELADYEDGGVAAGPPPTPYEALGTGQLDASASPAGYVITESA